MKPTLYVIIGVALAVAAIIGGLCYALQTMIEGKL